jgi:hypothetical protein
MAEGNTQHRYKEAITLIEEKSPGTKQQMYFGFLSRAAHRFIEEADDADLAACAECGAVTIAVEDGEPRCAFCKAKALAHRRRAQEVQPPSMRGEGRS